MKLLVSAFALLSLGLPTTSSAQEVPVAPSNPTGPVITDINAHRVESLPYVRRADDIVELVLPEFDLEDEVLFNVGGKPVLRAEFRRRMLMYLGTGEVEQAVTRLVTLQEIDRRVAAASAQARAELRDVMAGGGDDDSAATAKEKVASIEAAARGDFLPSEADIDAKIAELEELVAMQAQQTAAQAETEAVGPQPNQEDPGVQAIAEYRKSIDESIGMPKYREMLGAESSFEKVFLPIPTEATGEEVWDLANGPVPEDDPKPEWMPQVTWDALGADVNGLTLRQFVKGSAASGESIPAFFKGQVIRTIRAGVVDELGVDWHFDTDLPPEVFVRIGGAAANKAEAEAEIARGMLAEGTGDADAVAAAEGAAATARELVTSVTTDELWYLVSGQVTDSDVNLVLRELLTLRGMRSVLNQAGRWPGDDEFDTLFAEHEATYDGTLFPLRAIIMFKGYDSVDRYREHYRYRAAYDGWRRETMSEEELEEHYRAGARHFFERGQITVNAAFRGTSGYEFGDETFAAAEKQLMDAFQKVGTIVETTVESDPRAQGFTEDGRLEPSPVPQGPHTLSFREFAEAWPKPAVRSAVGDDRMFQRNPLRVRLTESELSIFLQGYSLVDDMFYNGVPGEIFGPWRATCRRHVWGAEINTGVWLCEVVNYVRGRPLAPLEDANRIQAEDDFLSLNYLYWAQECLERILEKVTPAEA
jgi:hypothetical protein